MKDMLKTNFGTDNSIIKPELVMNSTQNIHLPDMTSVMVTFVD